ncbi:ATP-binding protein [Vibrio metschnikovii]|uniref:ATP-binding protein n=1 Tax=Vibrio metschnikovii TaxID=28172 RepID=UPI002FCC15D4|nr:ATP-binding protein [Vibrio metschnikovii]
MRFQILKVTLDHTEYEISKFKESEKNLVSVMTGKNGAGKSRILEFITNNFYVSDDFLREHPDNWSIDFNNPKSDYSHNQVVFRAGGEICEMQRINSKLASIFKTSKFIENRYSLFPSRLICLSTSPFDRFPLNSTKKAPKESIYSYIGMKNSKRSSSLVSLVSNVLDSMFKEPEKIETNLEVIKKTLSYLGYGNRILVSYRSNFKLNEAELSRKIVSDILSNVDSPVFNKKNFDSYQWNNAVEEIYRSIQTLISANDWKWKSSFSVPIKLSKENFLEDDYIKSIQVLSMYELFSIKSLKLSMSSDNRKFVDFTQASSGEQCLSLMLLGIASQIENGALICIDEPEISLHPEWQEEFIPLIDNLFENYKGCHFVIATHSPLIISKLVGEHCSVLDLDRNELIELSNNRGYSSDYQLATLFQSPGFKNEYLVNESLDILTILSKKKTLNEDIIQRASVLIKLIEKLDENDPVHSLISTIKKVIEVIHD